MMCRGTDGTKTDLSSKVNANLQHMRILNVNNFYLLCMNYDMTVITATYTPQLRSNRVNDVKKYIINKTIKIGNRLF